MNPTFTCIYCQKSEPDVSPSEAHIFPDAMGGITHTLDTVCKACNQRTTKKFEQYEIREFASFQSIWKIKGRKGKVQGVSATVEFEGETFKLSLDENGLPKTPIVKARKDAMGQKSYYIYGPPDIVDKKKKEIMVKNPSMRWNDVDLTNSPRPELKFPFALDIGRKSLRRLAAKVAYERWAQLRGSRTLSEAQYEDIRNFILTGAEPPTLCGNLCDSHLLNGMLNFPIRHHAIVIIAHPYSRVLGSFVTFYGLFHFWVILSKSFQAVAAFDDILIEDIQGKKATVPLIRPNTGDLLVNWNKLAKPFLSNPEYAVNLSVKYAHDKFRKFEEKLWNIGHLLVEPTAEQRG
jgi:hypothetical protein